MSNTVTVKRANVILDIPEEQKDDYVKNGYSVIDSGTGAVIEASMPTDVHALQVIVAKLQKENEELKVKLAGKKEMPKTVKSAAKAKEDK